MYNLVGIFIGLRVKYRSVDSVDISGKCKDFKIDKHLSNKSGISGYLFLCGWTNFCFTYMKKSSGQTKKKAPEKIEYLKKKMVLIENVILVL